MEIQLNGYQVGVTEIHACKVYEGLLCGVIDTKRNNAEELKAKEKLATFSNPQDASLFFPPHREKRSMASFSDEGRQWVEEDFLNGFYSDDNYPEEKLNNFWIVVELVCSDDIEKHKEMDYCFSILSVAFNCKDFDPSTIEQYLYENLPIEIWNREARDYTP